IDFRDYTDLGWINNEDEKGNPIDISIGYTYNDIEAIRYNMTDNPVPDNFGNDSWSCWLPNSVTETIRFFRSGLTSSGNYKDFNYWETDSRISQNNTKETVFRANDDKFTLYVYIDDAVINNTNVFKEFDNRAPQPYIAKTGSNNASYWHKTNINDISRYNYHPNDGDNWYGYDQISKANNNLWYITLDNRPALNDDFTIASKRMPEYNDINTETSFGVFRYTNSGNTIHITGAKEIGLANHTDNYILTGTFNTSINSIVGSTTSVSEKCYGVWGEAPSLPTDNTKNYFVHTSEVDFVKVHFKYNGVNYSITMKTDDGKTWYTDAIPTNGTSAVTTGITFSDSNGNSWTNTGTRNNLQNYYYVISENGANSTGTGWRFPINITTSDTYYFKHYDNNVQNLTVKYTVSGVPFTVNLTKGTDGLWSTNSIAQGVNEITFSDGTNSWTVSNSGTTYYYHAKDSNFGYWAKEIFLKPTIWDKDNAWFAVHVFNDSDSYESFQIKLAETGTSGVYSAWIPSDSNTKLVFVRMNPSETEFSWDDGKKWNQTGDVKIVNDSNTFIITGWGSGTWYENRVLHFKPNGKWGTTDVTFRAWVWGSSSLSDQWIYIDGPDANGNYITEIDPSYTDIIFLRANKNTTGWNGEKNRIQTKYNGANTFTVTSSTSGTWSDQ
ncbi:MAG: hypothetical protein IKJ83_02120, partial [Ruminococcus sp.]|nr:hypothetical protein [Ruminococcus sp.]